MRRWHLIEIEDQPWCPRAIRDAATDYLQFSIRVGNVYAPVAEKLGRALQRVGARRVVDLCSGGAGPWPALSAELAEDRQSPVAVCLTDKFPNASAFGRARDLSGGAISFREDSIDAAAVPADLTGFRTIFSALHHFPPAAARAVLADAVKRRQGIGVFEATQRSVAGVLVMLLTPLMVWLFTPFIRPFRWSRLLWTYVIPVVPLVVLFDGIVSSLRTYTPAELHELTEALSADGYQWEIGEVRAKRAPVPVTYVIGCPTTEVGEVKGQR